MLPYHLNFCKSSGNIESHGTGPEEECNQGVVNDVAENFTPVGADERIFVIDTEAVGDAEYEVTDKGVNEESDCQDGAKFLLVLHSDEMDQCYQDKKGRDGDCSWVKYSGEHLFAFCSFWIFFGIAG